MKTFEQFYLEHYNHVLAITNYKLEYKSHNAEDITQEVFIKAHKAFIEGRYDGSNDKGWLGFIINNTIIDYWRKKSRQQEFTCFIKEDGGDWDVHDVHEPIETTIIKDDTMNWMNECISKLNPDFQDVVKNIILGDMSHKEFAKLRGISINTSLGRARYATKALKKMMAHEHNLNIC